MTNSKKITASVRPVYSLAEARVSARMASSGRERELTCAAVLCGRSSANAHGPAQSRERSHPELSVVGSLSSDTYIAQNSA